MALIQVHFMRRGKKFWADTMSAATIFYTFSWLLNIIVPLVLVFRSDGFWIKKLTFEEQPDINFKHQYLVLLELVRPYPGHLIHSTFPAFNKFFVARYIRSPQLSNYETDHNFDGLYDNLSFQLLMPLRSNEEVSGVDLFLMFDYKLRSKIHFDMETVVRISHRSITTGSKVFVAGDFRLNQKELLHATRHGDNFSHHLMSILSDPTLGVVSLQDLMEDYVKRNTTAELSSGAYIKWSSGRDVSNDLFSIDVKLNYISQEIAYRPGFWFVMKWAWIQYLAVFAVLYFGIEKVRNIVFDQHLIPTIQCLDG